MRKAATTSKRKKTTRRSPDGVLSRSPVSLRLFADELERLKAGANKEQRTAAAFARLCVLYGLAAYESGKSLTL